MMTSGNGEQQRGGGLMGSLTSNPAVGKLGEAARDYARARGTSAARKVGQRLGGVTDSLNTSAENGGFKPTVIGEAAKRVAQGDNPVKAAVAGVGSGVKEKVGEVFGRSKSGGASKSMTIIEDIYVGVPVDVAYNQWTQFQEFSNFMKGVDSVDQADDVTTNWRAKVLKSRRTWKATVTEQIPDRRIAWTSEGAKGNTKGVVTFHPLADDLTQVLLVVEYFPQGLFEKTGNLWRAQGRRARLDLKNFRRFIMTRGEATGSWRGEIRDGEVVRGPDEEEPDQEQAQGRAEDQDEDRDEDRDEDQDQDQEPDEPNFVEDRSPDESEERGGARSEDESEDESEDRSEGGEEESGEESEDRQNGRARSPRRRRQPAGAR